VAAAVTTYPLYTYRTRDLLRCFEVGTENVRVRSQQSGGAVAERFAVELVRDHGHVDVRARPLQLQRAMQPDDSGSDHRDIFPQRRRHARRIVVLDLFSFGDERRCSRTYYQLLRVHADECNGSTRRVHIAYYGHVVTRVTAGTIVIIIVVSQRKLDKT